MWEQQHRDKCQAGAAHTSHLSELKEAPKCVPGARRALQAGPRLQGWGGRRHSGDTPCAPLQVAGTRGRGGARRQGKFRSCVV